MSPPSMGARSKFYRGEAAIPDDELQRISKETNLNEYARSSILDSGTKGSRSTAMRKNSISTTARFRRRLQISLAQEARGVLISHNTMLCLRSVEEVEE
jgi:hypothetical protein